MKKIEQTEPQHAEMGPGTAGRGRKVLVTGPESTGKTDLCRFLAGHFNGLMVPEYARTYIENLKRPYRYADVCAIAREQRLQYDALQDTGSWIFFDTWLIITRVWMDVVYGKVPRWVDGEIRKARFDLVLVCAPDIPWIPDPVRENGGPERQLLYRRYIREVEQLEWKYRIVDGTGEERLRNALRILQEDRGLPDF
ncbi:MAG: ATP-binding protein [Bacteroidales bacterium]|nr:ATP-binding protein [Bacteroidales bacterium]MBN2697221.1 ATP-binding protein [Bacteroidales bacterium]